MTDGEATAARDERAEHRPLLSVITPVFQSATFLPDTLDSVAALDWPHEHFVVDGHSTDGTVELLKGREDSQLRWVSEDDRGQTHAVNKGLAGTTGELVAWLNGDDVFVADAVERALEHLARTPETGAVFGGLEFVDAAGEPVRTYVPAAWNWRRYLLVGDYVPTPTIIFRRALLAERGLLDERWIDAADYEFYLRLLKDLQVDLIPEPLVRFRYHQDSKTASNVWLQQDEALAIRLGWARGPRDRLLMKGLDRLKRAVLPLISAWPEPQAEGAARLVDRLRRPRG